MAYRYSLSTWACKLNPCHMYMCVPAQNLLDNHSTTAWVLNVVTNSSYYVQSSCVGKKEKSIITLAMLQEVSYYECLTIEKEISQWNWTARWENPNIYSGTMELLKVVMLLNGFVHFTVALSIEGVHKGTAEKQQNFINYNNGAQFMNELVIVCIILYFCLSCLSMPCILHLYPSMPLYVACLSMPYNLPVYPCHAFVRCLFIHAMYDGCLSILHLQQVHCGC